MNEFRFVKEGYEGEIMFCAVLAVQAPRVISWLDRLNRFVTGKRIFDDVYKRVSLLIINNA